MCSRVQPRTPIVITSKKVRVIESSNFIRWPHTSNHRAASPCVCQSAYKPASLPFNRCRYRAWTVWLPSPPAPYNCRIPHDDVCDLLKDLHYHKTKSWHQGGHLEDMEYAQHVFWSYSIQSDVPKLWEWSLLAHCQSLLQHTNLEELRLTSTKLQSRIF